MGKKKKLNQALLQLSGAALVLLGNSSQSDAAFYEGGTSASYRYSNYQEDETSNTKRYDIDIHQLHFFKPLNDDYSVAVDYTLEKMSGASPWYIVPDTDGKPIQIMSGATIKEKRQDVSTNINHKTGDTTLSVSAGHSSENDYKANYLKVSAEHEVKDHQYSIFGGMSVSRDNLFPHDAAIYNRIESADKQSNVAFAGLGIIINRNLVFSTALSYTKLSGFLTDPYKKVRIIDSTGTVQIINENRPDNRSELAWTNKLRYSMGDDSSLHVDFRYFKDDWEIASQTLDVAWFKSLNKKWQVIPDVRYYNQARAYFYAPYYNGVRSDGYYSGDYRLSPYGAISGQLKAVRAIGKFHFNMSFERYISDGSLALKAVTIENPSLVSFWLLTAGFDADF